MPKSKKSTTTATPSAQKSTVSKKTSTPSAQKSKASTPSQKRPAPKSTATTAASMIKVVKSNLKRGDITKVAAATGYEISHVGRVLRGVNSNPSGKIVTEAYRLVTSR